MQKRTLEIKRITILPIRRSIVDDLILSGKTNLAQNKVTKAHLAWRWQGSA